MAQEIAGLDDRTLPSATDHMVVLTSSNQQCQAGLVCHVPSPILSMLLYWRDNDNDINFNSHEKNQKRFMNGTHKEPDRFHGRALPHRLAAWTDYLHNTLLLSLPNSFLAMFFVVLFDQHTQSTFMGPTNAQQEK